VSVSDSRISSADVPMALIRVHVLARRLLDIERSLSRLPLHALVTHDGTDVSSTVVDAVIELERIRLVLSTSIGTVSA